MSAPESSQERLAKVIARSGLASRRAAERLVIEGHVQVNGEVVHHPGHPVDPDRDAIRVDGRALPAVPHRVWYVLYKPKGYITGRDDPEGRKSVVELVEHLGVRVEPVGRLDLDTEGALLFTNDGELAHLLTHPSTEVPKRYLAKIWKTPSDEKLRRMEQGLHLDDGRTAPCKVRIVQTTDTGNCWMELTVTEGRNRLVRRMFDAIGHPVNKLRRESFATISIRGLDRGQLRQLSGEEIQRLEEIGHGRAPVRAGHGTRYRKGFARPKPKPNKPLSRKRRTGKLKPHG